MAGYIADLEKRYGYMDSQFIIDLACRRLELTPDKLERIVGRYKNGKRKGNLKGKLVWDKVTHSGWIKMGEYDDNGFTAKKNETYFYRIVDSWTGQILYGGLIRY